MKEANRILFDTWAERWQQGCLLGNGFMGQVVYGRPGEEIVELSHGAFFSGSGNVDPYPEKGAEAFTAARKAAREGDYEEVYRQTGRLMGKRGNYGTNLPVGKLYIGIEGQPPVSDYGRYLDLDSGIAGCIYGSGENRHLREAFTSHEDHVFACRMEQTGAEMTLTVSFDGGRNPFRTWVEGSVLYFETTALETVHSDGTEGTRLYGAVKICAEDDGGEDLCTEEVNLEKIGREESSLKEAGSKKASLGDVGREESTSRIKVSGAKCAVLYLSMDVWTAGKEAEETETEKNARKHVKEWVNHEIGEYPDLRERHTADIRALMGRQKLKLGRWREESGLSPEQRKNREQNGKQVKCAKERTSENSEHTEMPLSAGELLDLVRQGGDNRRLTELMYQYGRYLLLSSSRQDSPLPAHLQGVWNDDVACQIGWTCDMHLDINTQMNYWISEPGNLRECHQPLFDWMEKRLIPNGRLTARKCYGYGGWVGELVSNAWGYAAPYWNESLSPCPTGGIWQATDYMEHYRYGQDREFLSKRVLPVIGEAVSFFLEYLFEDGEGHLLGGPSISPENAFLVNGKKYFASTGCTYEMVMIRELFLQYVESCRELGIGEGQEGEMAADQEQESRKAGQEQEGGPAAERKKEPEWGEAAEEKREPDWEELRCRVEKALPRLLPYRILPDGTLAEWNHDYEAADSQHRHTSHLLGLFPYGQITPEGTPALAKAAAASIKAKLTPYENWEDTGWARSLLALYSARLGEAEQAYRHLVSMQTILTGGNLLVMHPPTRGAGSFMEVYELDGNTGFSMAVMEMLIQSHGDCIHLLPALPEMWSEGKLEGAVVRGGILLDLYWEQGKPVKVTLLSGSDRRVKLRNGETVREYTLKAGQKISVSWHSGF